MKLLLKNGHVVSSFNRLEGDLDVLIEDNVIKKVAKGIRNKADKVIDCTGLTVIPGLCDMHVHFRDPGRDQARLHAEAVQDLGHGSLGRECAVLARSIMPCDYIRQFPVRV